MIEPYTDPIVTGFHPVVANALSDDGVLDNHPVFYTNEGATGPGTYEVKTLPLAGGSADASLWVGARIRCTDPDPATRPGAGLALSYTSSVDFIADPGLFKENAGTEYHAQYTDSQTGLPSGPTSVTMRVALLAPLPSLGQTGAFNISFLPVDHYAVKANDPDSGIPIYLGFQTYDQYGRADVAFASAYEFVAGTPASQVAVAAGFGAIEFFKQVQGVRTTLGAYRLIADVSTATGDGPVLSSAPHTILFDWAEPGGNV